MEIELNGSPHALVEGATVEDLIAALELTGKSLAVAINREVVPRNAWGARTLQAQDKVDVVKAIGGG